MDMGSIVVSLACGLLMVVGAVASFRWGNLGFERPWSTTEPDGGDGAGNAARRGLPLSVLAQRIVWYLDLVVLVGLTSGIAAAGAGGRLVMRLLAVTGSDDAQGRLTEAEEVVGAVTLDGTIILVVFAGAFTGLATAGLWLLLRRWLPSGRRGALVFSLLLLILVSTRLEPLRSDNPDFELVGPAGLAVATFMILAVFHASVVVALVGRLSHALPLISAQPRVLVAYAPLALLLLPGPVLPVVVIGTVMGAAMFILNQPTLSRVWGRPGILVAGRLALVALTALALPSFVGDITDILG